ncbi:MAG: glycine/betaine ABC transporter substrate-binding protein [Alphaproteobacteria bacterium]|nr:glycine/betaine ABC transporter substrate-binding protein [Alphaproteobacteria bacterium]
MAKAKIIRLLAGAAALAFCVASANAQTIVVGGKNFTEQQVLASLTSQYLMAKGYTVDERAGLGSAAVRQAQESGQVDVYWEYTGTSLITYNGIEEKLDAEATYQRVSELDAEKGLTWLEPSKANNTYAIAMRAADATEQDIASITDLAEKINGGETVTFASNAEFYSRPDGLGPMEEVYGFEFGRSNISRMDTGLVYQALRDAQVDTGLVFATDGRVPAFDFVILEDDKGYFANYALAPVVRTETLEANPELEEQLNAVSALLDDQVMAQLNAEVDVEQKSIEAVAKAFLEEHNLI